MPLPNPLLFLLKHRQILRPRILASEFRIQGPCLSLLGALLLGGCSGQGLKRSAGGEACAAELAHEWSLAANHGVRWPEARALVELLEEIDWQALPKDAQEHRVACALRGALVPELQRLCDRPEEWRPVPPRAWTDLRFDGEGAWRAFWTPQGERAEAAFAGVLTGPQPRFWAMAHWAPGLRADGEQAEELRTEARRLNQTLLTAPELPEGALLPLPPRNLGEEWTNAALLLEIQRQQEALAGMRWTQAAWRGGELFRFDGRAWAQEAAPPGDPLQGEEAAYPLEDRGGGYWALVLQPDSAPGPRWTLDQVERNE